MNLYNDSSIFKSLTYLANKSLKQNKTNSSKNYDENFIKNIQEAVKIFENFEISTKIVKRLQKKQKTFNFFNKNNVLFDFSLNLTKEDLDHILKSFANNRIDDSDKLRKSLSELLINSNDGYLKVAKNWNTFLNFSCLQLNIEENNDLEKTNKTIWEPIFSYIEQFEEKKPKDAPKKKGRKRTKNINGKYYFL